MESLDHTDAGVLRYKGWLGDSSLCWAMLPLVALSQTETPPKSNASAASGR
jgi:hypothetical protein